MATNITKSETETGWTIKLPDGQSFHVDYHQTKQLHAYLDRLIEPSEFRYKIRNIWKRIVLAGYKTRADGDPSRYCIEIKIGLDGEPTVGLGAAIESVSVETFVGELRAEDRAAAREWLISQAKKNG